MATIKHIKSRNANYSNALDYLLFQHNEGTMKPVLDDMGRKLLREEFYIDGLNCDPMSFDKDCELTNKQFHKNNKKAEIKSHHYIISFDPADATNYGLSGEKAQSLCLELAKKLFPGYQALIVTHTDGNNRSGNIHTHIVINSVRKYSVEREEYMSQPHDHEAGFKHRSTNLFLQHLQKEVMSMCEREGLHQVDLLSPATKKITQQEYMAQRTGQKKLNELNNKIIADGFTPTTTVYQTQKQFLRDAIDECSSIAKSFEDFQSLLLEKYNISVIESRGLYRYLHPESDKRTTEKSLGSHYGKQYLKQLFGNSGQIKTTNIRNTDSVTVEDYQRDSIMILYYKSQLRLVVDLQTNVKAMQNQAYAQKMKITNLQQMAKTIIYVQENGFDTHQDLKAKLSAESTKLSEAQERLSTLTAELKAVNEQIHFIGQYQKHKRIYSAFLKSNNKKNFRQEHSAEINAYEKARKWIAGHLADEQFNSLAVLKERKTQLQERIQKEKKLIHSQKEYFRDLKTADSNVSEILYKNDKQKQKSTEPEL